MRPLVLGTRGSALARRQTELAAEALRRVDPALAIDVREVHTEGDRRQDLSLDAIGGQGVFVKDIERLLQAGEIDVAVHSLKDMPAASPEGLVIGAVLPRGDVRDALVARNAARLPDLPPNARIGSDSRRRAVQLLALRPGLRVESIRGNVDTRVRKVDAGEYDAAVLAVAGLQRLGLLDYAGQVFSVEEMLPAVGQGVLAVQCRGADADLLTLLARVDDPPTRAAITAERAFLARLGAGCRLPVGAYARIEGAGLRLDALLAGDDGVIQRATASSPPSDATRLGGELADQLLARVSNATPPTR